MEVELPYSFPAVVNFLYFLYTGTLPSNLMHGANVDASSAQKPASTTENSPESAASARVDTDDDIIWRYELMMEMLHMCVHSACSIDDDGRRRLLVNFIFTLLGGRALRCRSVRLRVTELNVQLQSAIPVTPETVRRQRAALLLFLTAMASPSSTFLRVLIVFGGGIGDSAAPSGPPTETRPPSALGAALYFRALG